VQETDPAPEPDAEDQAGEFEYPLDYRLPGYVLVLTIVAPWLVHLPNGMSMTEWGISADILRQGLVQNIGLHMFAHAGILHLLFNSSALLAFSPPAVARLGAPPGAWLRFVALFLASGLAGLAFFLAIHPQGTIPMLGASGAIYGLIGFLVRFPTEQAAPSPLISNTTGKAIVQFIKENLLLVVLLTLPALLAGEGGGVAWETHLGGFVFGLVVGPRFMAPIVSQAQAPSRTGGLE
jgi:membrane associated rhomboid family serine protease